MKPIDVRIFKRLLHIEDDDFWFSAPGFQGYSPYRIASGAVRAVPLGKCVDDKSSELIRPLIRDPWFRPGMFSDDEKDELEPWNPTGENEAELLAFPAGVREVVSFLDNADLWCMVDMAYWLEYGLPDPENSRESSTPQPFRFHVQRERDAEDDPPPPPPTPPLIKTPALAEAFGRHAINGWNVEQWKKNLGKGQKYLPNWMKEAWQAGPGTPAPDFWNPVKLALGVPKLKDDNQDEYRRIGRAFAEPELLAWQGEWQRYSDLL